MGWMSRLADRIDARLDKLKPPTREELKTRNRLRKKNDRWHITVWEPKPGARFKTSDETQYGWLSRPTTKNKFACQLRVSRGVWPKGHAGKVLRKSFNRLHRQGHHSVTTCFEILAARAAR